MATHRIPQRPTPTGLALLLLIVAIAAPTQAAPAAPAPAPVIAIGKAPPPIVGVDTDGHKWSLASTLGHPVVLFFFCGCNECHRVGASWAAITRAEVLSAPPFAPSGKNAPITVIVLSDNAADTKQFAADVGLTGVVLIPDSTMRVTNVYGVDPCPRAFVLDPKGLLRYTNNGRDDAPQQGHEDTIVGRALTALRAQPTSPPRRAGSLRPAIGRKRTGNPAPRGRAIGEGLPLPGHRLHAKRYNLSRFGRREPNACVWEVGQKTGRQSCLPVLRMSRVH